VLLASERVAGASFVARLRERHAMATDRLRRWQALMEEVAAARRLVEGGRAEEGIAALETLAEKAPGVGEVHYLLAFALRVCGRSAEAQLGLAERYGFDPYWLARMKAGL
jgi:predicted Zn-dependent protease